MAVFRVKYDLEYDSIADLYRFKGKPPEVIKIVHAVAPDVFFDSSNDYEPEWVDSSALSYNYGDTVFFDVGKNKNLVVLSSAVTGDCLAAMNDFVNVPGTTTTTTTGTTTAAPTTTTTTSAPTTTTTTGTTTAAPTTTTTTAAPTTTTTSAPTTTTTTAAPTTTTTTAAPTTTTTTASGTTTTSVWPLTEDFQAIADGADISSATEWVDELGVMTCDLASTLHCYRADASYTCTYYNTAINANHYSQAVLERSDVTPNRYTGVAVRIEGAGSGNYYAFHASELDTALWRLDAGTPTQLGSTGNAIVEGDTIELRASGTTLSCYVNDALFTSVATSGQFTDSTHTGGYVGIAARTSSASFLGNTWEGGEL